MAADEGGGKPRGDAEQGSDADDLDALAGGLGSLAPEGEATAEGEADAEDEAHDLAALAALAARTSLATPEGDVEAAALRLSSSDGAASSADRPVTASASGPAPAPRGGASIATPVSDLANTDFAAAATAAVVLTPRARAAWMTPLLVGIGVGIGIAGVTYVLSQRDVPAASANAATSVPAEPPVAAQPAQPAPAVVPAVVPSAPAGDEQAAAAAPEASAAHASVTTRPRADVPTAAAERPSPGSADKPVLSVQPASDQDTAAAEAEEPDLAATVAADKPASTMDALLDEALSPKARRDELAARQQAALEANAIPATPSREEVTQAMTVLLPAIRGCAMGQSGLATAGIVVHSDGRVASVEVAGAPFAGSASGRCMEGVLRRARFPRFTQPSFRIKFPLAIQ